MLSLSAAPLDGDPGSPGAGANRFTMSPRIRVRALLPLWLFLMIATSGADAAERSGRLLTTGGLIALGGAAGGGLTPWALIAGYGTRDEVGAAVHVTHSRTQDLALDQTGVAVGIADRLELSIAEQRMAMGGRRVASGVPSGIALMQSVLGLKLRLIGDAVFDQDTWQPQLALGVLFKDAANGSLLRSAGARDDRGVDFYLSATKYLSEERWLLNATLRSTRANHLGLMGFGGPSGNRHGLEVEGTVAFLLDNRTSMGIEYRGKPDRLPLAREHDWVDAFIAYFPRKSVACSLAYVRLGEVAGVGRQDGVYTSVQVGF